jgi:hypothetical protein
MYVKIRTKKRIKYTARNAPSISYAVDVSIDEYGVTTTISYLLSFIIK